MRTIERLAGVAIVAALGLSACGEQSHVDPAATVSVQGSFRDIDGSPLAARPVRLGSGVSVAEGGLGFLTVGLSCIGGGCSGKSFDTTTDGSGSYHFSLSGRDTRSSFGEAESFLISSSAPPPESRPSGPAISARFRVQTTHVELPALALADVRPELHASDDGTISASWDGAVAPAPYTVTYRTTDGTPVWETAVNEPTAAVDGRVLEDLTGLATVRTSRSDAIEGSDLAIVTQSSGVAFRGGFGPPPSRGARCEARSEQGPTQAMDRCPLTDADFGAAAVPTAVCPGPGASSATTVCDTTTGVRVLLDEPLPAQLVVVRGCRDPCRVAPVGVDGSVGDAVGVSAPFGVVQLGEDPLRAVDVLTTDVSALTEVSIWPATAVDDVLLPVDDPTGLLGGGAGEHGRSNRLPAASAAALLALVILVLGVVVGRRTRPQSRDTAR